MRRFDTAMIMRPAAVAITLAATLQPAVAGIAFALRCKPDAPDAQALCADFGDVLTHAGWQMAETGIAIQMEVQNLRPTSIRVSLTVTTPDGRSQVVNRGFSAHDTTITPKMRADFLSRLLAAIPSEL